ncbi:hypothetical protein GOP47_0020627 [Adiantum capillus-veneris]|uniref:TOG domain-containing protein n=1 Tax=Adiantum capillus-veneris TaxID=13818 RepID=A0A9D4UAB4_ADICA|nr:hypothetical protein GOP47_0020627 [Adiantum capillus-veneris]
MGLLKRALRKTVLAVHISSPYFFLVCITQLALMSKEENQKSRDVKPKEENLKARDPTPALTAANGPDCKPALLAAHEPEGRSADPSVPEPSHTSQPCRTNGDEPASAETEYILSKDLKPLEGDVRELVDNLLARLDSKDWISVCEALNYTRQLATFHSASLVQILSSVVTLMVKAMKNPRSALCKTAIMASADFFKSYQDQMLDLLDPLLLQLLLKASQDKRFVCEEAEKALVAMTSWISPNPLLLKLQPCLQHRNPRVRAKASSCVCRSVSRLGTKGIKDFGLETLIRMGASQLNDQLPEAREAARQLVMEIREAHQQQYQTPSSPSSSSTSSSSSSSSSDLSYLEPEQPEQWEQFCQRQLPPRTALAVLRATCMAN